MDFFMQELGVPGSQLLLAAEQTLYMVFPISIHWYQLLGLIIAVTLVVTNPNGIVKNSIVYTITNTIVNIVRSVPFIILMVFILPLTKMIVGTRLVQRRPSYRLLYSLRLILRDSLKTLF